METVTRGCPNCGAPVRVPLGEVETVCEYCGSQLRFIPDAEEMEVVRTREEMLSRERVAIQKAHLKKKLEQEELARWREMAGRVAVSAMPVVGDVVGRALFRSAVTRGSGAGCGCLGVLVALGGALALLL
jgi:hypothetical protein